MTGLKRKFTPNEAGAYESLLIEEYIRAPGLSKSVLTLLRDGCPAKFKAEVDGQRECKQTPAMFLGSALHARLLDREQIYHVAPDDVDLRTKKGKQWAAEHSDLPILTKDKHEWVVAASNATRNHGLAWSVMCGGRREVSLFAKYRGRLMKGRPDVFNPPRIIDIKTLSDASDKAFSKAIADYGWHIQAATYWKLAVLLGFAVTECYLVGIEKPAPDTGGMRPLLNVKRISSSALELGQHELDALLDKLDECERNGTWPDYSGGEIGEIDCPRWSYPPEQAMELNVAGRTLTL